MRYFRVAWVPKCNSNERVIAEATNCSMTNISASYGMECVRAR
jgi:hypothetical protein